MSEVETAGQSHPRPWGHHAGETPQPAVNRVLDYIEAQLDEGSLRPGDRLNSLEIATALQLSRSPVREALHILAGRGFVELLPDRGAVLRRLDKVELIQLLQVIVPISVQAMTEAARRDNPPELIAQLKSAMSDLENVGREVFDYRWSIRTQHFHSVVHKMTGNPFYDQLMRRMGIEYWARFAAEAMNDRSVVEKGVRNYQRITESILAGDGNSAGAAMEFHFDLILESIRRKFDSGSR